MSISTEKVIISLTTISSRVSNIHRVIASLLNQSYQTLEVRLYLSEDPYLLDEGIRQLPDKLAALVASDQRFQIIFTENTGPYRKLLPTLEECWGTDQLLITVDDDVEYPPNVIATLVCAESLFRCPVAFRGRRATLTSTGIASYKQWIKQGQAGKSMLNVPTGKDGVIYRPSFFFDGVLDNKKAIELAKTTDDLWFKWHTVVNGLPSVLLFDSLSESFKGINKGVKEIPDLFTSFNNHGSNDQVVKNLEDYFLNKTRTCLFKISESNA